MRISDIINRDSVEIGAELYTKDEVLERLVALQKSNGTVRNTTALRREIDSREQHGTSALSGRVAIPAVAHSGAPVSGITAVTVKDGVDYGAPDKKRVKLIFMIAGKSGSDEYLHLKTRLMRLLMDTGFTAQLCAAKSTEEFLRLLSERENVRFAPSGPKKEYDCSKFLIENYPRKERLSQRIRRAVKDRLSYRKKKG